MTTADLKVAGHEPRPWSTVEAEAVIGKVLVGVKRACTWQCERWRWFAVPILVIDKGNVSARPVHARARGHAPTFQAACRLAESAAKELNREHEEWENEERKRRRERKGERTK